MEPFNPIRAAPTRRLLENFSPSEKTTFCPQCSENYGKEVAKLTAIHKSFCRDPQPSLPQWLQNAKLNSTDAKIVDHSHGKVNELLSKQETKELQKKWRDLCLHLHPHFHQCNRTDRPAPPTLLMTSLYNPNVLREKPLGEGLQLNTDWACSNPAPVRPPGSPVSTDLVLGRNGIQSTAEKDVENRVKDFLGCISSEPHTKLLDKFSNALDADVYKKLLKGLMVRAWWQAEAASMVASAITRCRLGNGKRWGGGSRGDIWLLFAGPDRVGKKKMATAIAEHTCGACPIMICLGARSEEPHMNFRGKTAIDRIAEAIRRNPFSVIMLQDIDESDVLVRGNIKQAMERGRIADSHGREVSLRNAVFILMGDWSSGDREASEDSHFVDEKKLASVASGNWQLGLIVREKTSKRRPSWLPDDDDNDHDRPVRPRKELGPGRSLDLNVDAVKVEDYQTDGSHNPSSLTIDHEGSLVDRHFSVTSVPQDLVNNVEDSIMFKPVDPALVQWEIKKTISLRFSTMVDENVTLEIEDDVLEMILGALWHDETSLEEWVRKVLEPSFDRLKLRLPSSVRSSWVVRMVVKADSSSRGSDKGGDGDWLPSSILV